MRDGSSDVCSSYLFGEAAAMALRLDVSSQDSVAAGLEAVLKWFGAIHVLVNNAAVDPEVTAESIVETSRLENFPLDKWHFQLNVGLTGALLCSQEIGRAT